MTNQNTPTLTFRPMEPGEAAAVLRIARRAFTGLESLWSSKPKCAIVAVLNGQIAGAVQYKILHGGGKTIGYFAGAFIAPEHQNQGIGGALYRAAASHLWAQGCDALSAIVKDDNVGSWKLFLQNGFSRVSLPVLLRRFGLVGTAKQYLCTPFCIGGGMDYYAAFRETPAAPVSQDKRQGGSGCRLLIYLLANLLLFLPALFHLGRQWPLYLAALLFLLGGGALAGYLSTLFSGRGWQFRMTGGGGVICAAVNLIGLLPMTGNWYPQHYENTPAFRRDMGLTALAGWLFLLLVVGFASLWPAELPLLHALRTIGANLMLFRILAFYPFESFGGQRVLRWSPRLFLLLATLSIGVLFL